MDGFCAIRQAGREAPPQETQFQTVLEAKLWAGGKAKRERKRLNPFLFDTLLHRHPLWVLFLPVSLQKLVMSCGAHTWSPTAVQFSRKPSFFAGFFFFLGLNFPSIPGFQLSDG